MWGHPYWAHVISYDLAHWQRLPVGLIPDTPYDIDGVFSGSASIRPDGQPVILFTAVSNLTELDYYYQVSSHTGSSLDTITTTSNQGRACLSRLVTLHLKLSSPGSASCAPNPHCSCLSHR